MTNLILYLILAGLLYFVVIACLNRIPNVSVKSFGFLSIGHVSIKIGLNEIYAKDVKLRFRIFGRRLQSRFLKIVANEVELKFSNQVNGQDKGGKKRSDSSNIKKQASRSFSEMNNVTLPGILWQHSLFWQIVNHLQFVIMGVLVRIGEKSTYLFFDRVSVTGVADHLAHLKFTTTFCNCTLLNDNDRSQRELMRSLEVGLAFTLVGKCEFQKSKAHFVSIRNCALKISVNKLSIPLEYLLALRPHDTDRKKQEDGKHTSELYQNELLEEFLGVFSLLELNLEDSDIIYKDFFLEFVNILTKVQYSPLDINCHNKPLTLLIIMSSLHLYHQKFACFELPTCSFSISLDPIPVARILLSSLLDSQNQICKGFEEEVVIASTFSASNPVIDIYYDQIDGILSSPKKENKSKPTISANKVKNYLSFINRIKSKITIGDTVVRIHLPQLESKEFHRDSQLNMIVVCSILSLNSRFVSRNMKEFKQKGTREHKLDLKHLCNLLSLKIEVAGNVLEMSKLQMLIVYNLFDSLMAIKISSKKIKLRSINDVIFRIIRNLRNRAILLNNRRYTELTCDSFSPSSIPQSSKDEVIYYDVVEFLPEFISSLKVDLTSIEADIICKDGLPLHKVFDKALKEEIDLKDFRRGITLRLSDISFSLKRKLGEIDFSVNLIEGFTSSEYSTEFVEDFDIVADYQVNNVDLDDISSIDSSLLNFLEDSNLIKVKKVLSISEVVLFNKQDVNEKDYGSDKSNLILQISEIDGRIDVFLIWCCVYAFTLLKYFSPTVKPNCSREQLKMVRGARKKLKLDIIVHSTAIVIRLPQNVDMMIELDSMKMENIFVSKFLKTKLARIYVVHPSTKLWARLLIIRNFNFGYEKSDELKNDVLQFDTEVIRFNIPHQFLVYTVIDNLITLVKTIRQIRNNFNLLATNENYERIMPMAKPATKLPCIRVKAQKLGLIIENDLFENELSYIFELGRIEQQIRLKKWKAFQRKASQLMDESVELERASRLRYTLSPMSGFGNNSHANTSPLNEELADSIFRKKVNTLHSLKNSHLHLGNFLHRHKEAKISNDEIPETDTELPSLITEEVQEKIERAERALKEQFSTSWILKFRKFKEVKVKEWANKSEEFWGKETISDLMTSKFDIIDYADGPSLLGAVFRNVDLELGNARVDNIDDFLRIYGKGQPKLEYSILIPIFLSLKASTFYCFLKDYHLPLVSLPSNSEKDDQTICVEGNFVINEKLVHRKEEMRFIFVPFLPSVIDKKDDIDTFYSLFVPRTLTPVKVMFDLSVNLSSERACMLTWCKSYQAGILAALAALDKFTKPKIDDSPIGWWDKLSLIAHGKVGVKVANELCLHMKSSLSPYDLSGKASGFVFVWKNNVELGLNKTGKSQELVTLHSDDFILAIPRYSPFERESWSMNIVTEGTEFMDNEGYRKYQKEVIKLASADKVRWTFGFLFERNVDKTCELSDHQERTTEFKNHYDVIVTNPKYEWHPDSYEDFRSDYIHMALSVVSKSENGGAYNAAYFTPYTFHNFYYWWNTLTRNSSMPIKRGNLFNKNPIDTSSIKMGPHIFTVKYQLIFEPLSLSHMYLHSTGDDLLQKSKIAFTGLKGKVSSCSIDLHQTKEMIRYVNERLNINNKLYKLKMNAGSVEIDNCDVRLLLAVFKEKSVRAYLESFIDDSNYSSISSDSPTSSTFGNGTKASKLSDWLKDSKFKEEEIPWIDPADYVELYARQEHRSFPDLKIYPILTSPKISYIRDFRLHETGPYPFGDEPSHDCIIHQNKPEQIQKDLLEKRVETINQDIQSFQVQIDKLNLDAGASRKEHRTLFKHIEDAKMKVKVLNEILKSLQDDSYSTSSCSDEELSRMSTSYSVYTARKSLHDLKEMTSSESSMSDFHNRFIFYSPHFKWNNRLRDGLLEYFQQLSDRKSQVYFMSRRAVSLIESVVNQMCNETDSDKFKNSDDKDPEFHFTKDYKSNEEVIEGFRDQIGEIPDDNLEMENKYLIKFFNPQIQMISERDPNSSVLVASQDVELRIVSVNAKGTLDIVSENNEIFRSTESRYGFLLQDAHIFVFKEEQKEEGENLSSFFERRTREEMNWQKWLGPEICYDSSWILEKLVAERSSISVVVKKPNFYQTLRNTALLKNQLNVNIARLVINADSIQYSSLYFIITDLLVHTKTKRDVLMSKLDKILSLSDIEHYNSLTSRVVELQESFNFQNDLRVKIDQLDPHFYEELKDLINALGIEHERCRLELILTLRGVISKKDKYLKKTKYWTISLNLIIWHLLNEIREPLIDIALAQLRFTGIFTAEGAHANKIAINMIQGFNLQRKALYPELLMPLPELYGGDSHDSDCVKLKSHYSKDRPVIYVSWKTMEPVGGILIMQELKIGALPLKVALDYDTAKKLFEYVFPEKDKNNSNTNNISNNNNSEHRNPDIEGLKESRNPLKKLFKSRHSNSDSSLVNFSFDDTSSAELSNFDALDDSSDSMKSSTLEDDLGNLPMAITKECYDSNAEMDLILERSAKYTSIVNVEVEQTNISVSFHANNHLNILNVDNLKLSVPTLSYSNKLWTGKDFILHLKRDLLKIILNHTGRIISNKFKHSKKKSLSSPLKQVSNYSNFITVNDLQSEGRSRDFLKNDIVERFLLFPNMNKNHQNGDLSSKNDKNQHHHHHHYPHHHHDSQSSQKSGRSRSFKFSDYLENVDSEEDKK